MSVYNFIRRGLVIGLAEKTAKSKSMAFKSKSKSSKSGLKAGLKSKSGLEYYKSAATTLNRQLKCTMPLPLSYTATDWQQRREKTTLIQLTVVWVPLVDSQCEITVAVNWRVVLIDVYYVCFAKSQKKCSEWRVLQLAPRIFLRNETVNQPVSHNSRRSLLTWHKHQQHLTSQF